MSLIESQEKFIEDYRIFILDTIKILRRFPELIVLLTEKEKLIHDNFDEFRNETLILLTCLEDLYARIEIDLDNLTIEATTKKIFISYYDKNRGYKGVKKGGKYVIIFSLRETAQISPYSFPEYIYVRRPEKIRESPQPNSNIGYSSAPMGHIHPHVNTNSKVCWLNMKNHILFLLQKLQVLEVFLCAYEFLSRVNLESCYAKEEFLRWKEVEI